MNILKNNKLYTLNGLNYISKKLFLKKVTASHRRSLTFPSLLIFIQSPLESRSVILSILPQESSILSLTDQVRATQHPPGLFQAQISVHADDPLTTIHSPLPF